MAINNPISDHNKSREEDANDSVIITKEEQGETPSVSSHEACTSSEAAVRSVADDILGSSVGVKLGGIDNFMRADDIMNESTKVEQKTRESTGSKTITDDVKCSSEGEAEDLESVDLGVSVRVGAPNLEGGAWTEAGKPTSEIASKQEDTKLEGSLLRMDSLQNTGEVDEESILISPGKKCPEEPVPPALPSTEVPDPTTPINAKSVLAKLQAEEQDATLAGLASGQFDVDVQKLKTVSLPDLNDIDEKVDKIISLSDNEDESNLGGSKYHTPRMGNDDVSKTSHSLKEDPLEESSLESDVEEYDELVRSLQSVLNQSEVQENEEDRYDTCSDCKFEPAPSDLDDEQPSEEYEEDELEESSSGVNDADSSKNCSVRSQSPQFEDSCQDEMDFFAESDSVFARLEQSREALERRIGHDVLLQAYSIIQVSVSQYYVI